MVSSASFFSIPDSIRFSLLAICFVFSLTVDYASAQNLKKVERKLEDLVDRGHLMPRHAHAMLETLHGMVDEEENAWEEGHHEDEYHDIEEKREHIQEKLRNAEMEASEIKEKIKHAVESGELKKEEAREKMREAEMGVHHARLGLAEVEAHLLELELKQAVEDGELSEQNARKKMEAFRRELKRKFEGGGDKNPGEAGARLRKKRENLVQGVKKRMKIAVERGDITEQQAEERMKGLMQQFQQEDERRLEVEKKLKDAGAKLRTAVEAGKVSADDARERYEEYRKKLVEESKELEQHQKNDSDHEHDDDDNHESETESKEGDG